MSRTKEILCAERAAAGEQRICSNDLIAELLPLVNDYFVGSFYEKDGEMILSFLNGQKFALSVRELKTA